MLTIVRVFERWCCESAPRSYKFNCASGAASTSAASASQRRGFGRYPRRILFAYQCDTPIADLIFGAGKLRK